MPPATRQQAHSRRQHLHEPTTVDATSDDIIDDAETITDPEMVDAEDEEEDEAVEEEDIKEVPFPPPGLREVSSLASWTVSTAKPGCGVAALRNPDTSLFWQSDGPLPHLLSIHFIKLVSIMHMRIFLDSDGDESYTPTKIQFLAGMSPHDVQEFAEMSFERAIGWIDVDFSNVQQTDTDEREDEQDGEIDWSKRPVLRAFVVQVRILENHQNGKDTHLRCVQLFAADQEHASGQARRDGRAMHVPKRLQKSVWGEPLQTGIRLAPWMMDPELR